MSAPNEIVLQRFDLPDQGFEQRKRWADGFADAFVQIIREKLSTHILSVSFASPEDDMLHATDLVVTLDRDQGQIATRVRHCLQRDFTLRYRCRPWGVGEFVDNYEVRKILEGWARWYVYGWASGARELGDWVIVDLDRLRASGLIELAIAQGREIVNKDDRSTFIWMTPGELAELDCVVDTTLEVKA